MVDLDSSSDCDLKLEVNSDYASKYDRWRSKYDRWRSKEELQRLKDKYGDVNLDDVSESSSSEEEDEDAEALTPQLQKDFLRTLAALKSRDPKIYNESVKFFNEQNESRNVPADKRSRESKKAKPMFLKDYEREVIVEHGGKFIDDDDDDENESDRERNAPPGYFEEQEDIRQSFKKAVESADEGSADELLSVRVKTDEEQAREEADYMEWLKGQKDELSEDKDIAVELDPLRKFWTDPKLAEGERFLRDYLLNKQYLDDNDDDKIPSYDEIIRDLEDDEKELDKEEEFERKYNFRFEEPDAEFIKSYPRVIPETLRNRDTRRVKLRQSARERKRLEKEKKREDLKRLKNLKKKEILEKIDKLKEITGNTESEFTERDVDGDFDDEEYDQMMKKVFDADYYGQQADHVKPVFSDDDGDVENWDDWQPSASNVDGTVNTGDGEELEEEGNVDEDDEFNDGLHCEDPDFVMDADYDPSQKRVKEKKKKGRRRTAAAATAETSSSIDAASKKKKSQFAAALEKPKPVFDGKSKSFEEYFDEYYGLDYEDVIGDLPVRFKYRKVVPNDFGLSVDEVLAAPDKELNAWVSVKKMSQYRPEDEETRDVVVFQRKKSKKFNVLPSLREPEPEDVEQVESSKKRKKKKRKRSATTAAAADVGNTERNSQPPEELKVSEKPPKKKQRKHSEQSDGVQEKPEITISPKKSDEKQANSATTWTISVVDSKMDASTDVKSSLDKIKSKKAKKRKNVAENVTNVARKTENNLTRESEENVDESKEQKKKKKKKNRRKLPTISDDRLKAYGIDPKKYKYFHSKKLLQLPVNKSGNS